MARHLDSETFQQFIDGKLDRKAQGRAIRHLMSACERCSEVTTEFWHKTMTTTSKEFFPPSDHTAAFEAASLRAIRTVQQLEDEDRSKHDLFTELMSHSSGRRRLLVHNSPRFWTHGLCESLLDEAMRLGFADANSAIEVARLATETASRLDQSQYGRGIVNDIRCRAWATLGNALRISSDYNGAEEAFGIAGSFLGEGTGDELVRARYLMLRADLYSARRDFSSALGHYSKLRKLYQRLGDNHMVGRLCLRTAFVYGKMRDLEKETRFLTRAIELLEPARDPRRWAIAHHHLAAALIDSGKPEEAEELLDEVRRAYRVEGDALSLIRVDWLEGRIAYLKGELPRAVEILGRVRDQFVDREIGIDVALSSLDLAEVLVASGNLARSREYLAEAIPILKALRVRGEAIAAMAFLKETMVRETVAKDLIRRTVTFINKTQGDPKLRFEPSMITGG